MAKFYCAKCGKTLDAGDRFCRYCGSSDIKEEVIKKPADFEIKDGVLYKCNISGIPGYDYRVQRGVYDSFKEEFRYAHLYSEARASDIIYYALKAVENNLPLVDYSDAIREFANNAKKSGVLTIPSSVRLVKGQYKGECAFSFKSFYAVNYSPNTEFEGYAFSNSFIYKFTLPMKMEEVGKTSFGELTISDITNVELMSCNIIKLNLPSSITVIHDRKLMRDVNPKGHEICLVGCIIKELIVGRNTKIVDHRDSSFGRSNIEILRYGGSKNYFFENDVVHFAKKIVCYDGTISYRRQDHADMISDVTNDTKMINITLKNDSPNGLGFNEYLIKFTGVNNGYIYFVSRGALKTHILQVPASIRSIEFIKQYEKPITIYRPSYGEWVIDVKNQKYITDNSHTTYNPFAKYW